MTTPPETQGQWLTAQFGGGEFKLPSDVDDWPLTQVSASVGVKDKTITVNYGPLATALQILLGSQWPALLACAPRRKDLVAASHSFATAAGFKAEGAVDKAFGALPRRLAVLELYPGPVEATLRTLGVRYTDRWRFDVDGQRKLTLREIHVLLRHAAYDSPLAIALNDNIRPLSDAALACMDLYEAITKTAHPGRPLTREQRRERRLAAEKKADAVADYRRRHNKPATAIETARANANRGDHA